MKIAAIFSDYDGTLAPEDAPLESSAVPTDVEEPMRVLASAVPVAIVTSKDSSFVRPRTRFAAAWACASGLEIVLRDGRTFSSPVDGDRLRDGLRYVRGHGHPGLDVELKRSTEGALLGFSVDWRSAGSPPPGFVDAATTHLEGMDLEVVYDPARPFFDVFGARPDKGNAVRELRKLLEVTGSILFMGDSGADNPAFDASDAAICVSHGQSLEGLSCRFALEFEALGHFLRSLAESRLSFDPGALAPVGRRSRSA